MRFEFFHDALAAMPKLSVDGIVPGDGLHLSHWAGNRTPVALKADTSTGIALRFVASPERADLARGAEVATNNHFDTDGVLSVWTVLEGPRAQESASVLVGAAEAGDFSAHPGRDALKITLAIQGDDGEAGSPLAAHLHGGPVDDDELAYRLVLPVVADLLGRPDAYEPLWRPGLERVDAAMESLACGRSTVEEDADGRVSLVVLAPDAVATGTSGQLLATPPFAAISHHVSGRLVVVATPARDGGWVYRIDWPYWSWADTVDRPHIERADLAAVAARLSELEPDGWPRPRWRVDASGLTSALSVFSPDGEAAAPSRVSPADVARELRAAVGRPSGRAPDGIRG